LHIDSSSPLYPLEGCRRPILRQNPPVFLPIALLFGRHTSESGIKIFSPNARFTMRNGLLAPSSFERATDVFYTIESI